MATLFRVILIASLINLSSCAFLMNKKEVDLSISSNPSGANIIINNRNYGTTPKIIKITPKNYNINLQLPNYGSSNFQAQTWQSVRKGSEGFRCIMDALGSVLILPYFSFMSSYCKDFKQKDFLITIPQNNAKNANLLPNNGPMPIGSQIPNSYPNRYNQARKRNIANNSYNSAQYQQQYNSYYNPYDNDNISHYQNNNNYNSNPSKPIIKNYPQNILPNNDIGQNLYRDVYSRETRR
ncbi:MAG: hypothetical protein CMP18_01305 [Rickettsiales bacterium]|nr:hypothetical protein [Rickettsiales bacterium]|tara:strand:+ start:9573 stop:10286 length:714 start_codon:yes stop_codon:yes gene_type:complete